MSTAGIVCEYNPFHLGHKYHIEKTRELLGEDTGIVCVMSGNFVQRGDCAVFAKHSRAKAAVLNGADLVLELPIPWVLSSAEGFAYGAVSLLDALGVVTHLSFGSESGDIGELRELVKGINASENRISELMATGISYASARQKALDGKLSELIESPNNILGVEYIKALERLGSSVEPVTVSRHMTDHDSEIPSDNFASASFIRNTILNGTPEWKYVPESGAEIFENEPLHSLEYCERAILGKLRSMTKDEFDALPFGGEGLGNRLMNSVMTEASLDAIMEKTKSKRYPMSRIRRMILCAWLGVSPEDSRGEPPYIRVLAASERGCEMLREIKKKSELPVITKPASAKEFEIFRLEAKSTALYNLTAENIIEANTEWNTSPFINI
ncbi:MAG: nucleotidyltransferase family protein [Ruminococcaceae bacterium]|nr:nucleotidyltransferase family protein [Oscillospiraceae bacterium]